MAYGSYNSIKYSSTDQVYFDRLFLLNKSILKPIGCNVNHLRIHLGIGIRKIVEDLMARSFKTSYVTIRGLERGMVNNVSVTYLSALADYFDLTIYDLIISDYSILENVPKRVRLKFGKL